MAEPHESRVYSDFAHLYDHVFGRAFVDHERDVIQSLALRPGHRLLEVGVGTGISLGAYPPYVKVVAVDSSLEMLEQAQAKIKENNWRHIELAQGNALSLNFPDDSFDVVCAFHVISVVPDPRRAMSEMRRVCKPGGRIAIINHFRSENSILGTLTAIINPVTKHLGWTTLLRLRDVLQDNSIRIERREKASRFSVHTVVIMRKEG
jgi:phosphatidylethanolamine/phosphatidyl-N-methylethanolamine N-methyltransferase